MKANNFEWVTQEQGRINRLWIEECVEGDSATGNQIVFYLVLNGIRILRIKNNYMASLCSHGGFGVPIEEYLIENKKEAKK